MPKQSITQKKELHIEEHRIVHIPKIEKGALYLRRILNNSESCN